MEIFRDNIVSTHIHSFTNALKVMEITIQKCETFSKTDNILKLLMVGR